MSEELRNRNGLTEAEFLAAYRPGDYERPSVTVDMLIFAAPGLSKHKTKNSDGSLPAFLSDGSLKLLLIRRGGHPCLGRYALPGGFVNSNETVMEAARRELVEETGVTDVPLIQLYTFSQPGRDVRTWVMSCAHMALLDTNDIPIEAGDDADSAEWFTLAVKKESSPASNGDDRFHLSLVSGSLTLEATLSCPAEFDETACMEEANNGLAFDHAKMILCGLKQF